MTMLDHDEAAFAAAIATVDLDRMSDPASVARAAVRAGTRVRRRRTATGLSCAAVLTLAVGGGALGIAHDRATRSHAPDYTGRPQHASQTTSSTQHHRPTGKHHEHAISAARLQDAYAVLDAPGWTAPGPQPFVLDEKLYYSHGDDGVSLNWRPGGDPGKFGTVIGPATLDGDAAEIRRDPAGGGLTVVGPVRDGRMLTLTATRDIDVDQLRALATHVHRQ